MSNVRQIRLDRVDNVGHFFYFVKYRPIVAYTITVGLFILLYCHIPNFTALVTGHGKTRAYLHRFKLIESPTCPCGKEEQTTDHLIYRCILLQQPRETLKRETSKQGTWPTNKQDLINKHLKQFMKFTNSIAFDVL
jgi:hypothetical protein